MTAPPIVQAKVGRSDRVTEGDDAKENLRHARRTNTLRKRRIEALEATVKSLERELREMNATLVQQEERLATNGVDNLLEVLVTRKQEIDALSALLGEKTKEVNRLNTLVQRRDETIRSLRVKVLTDKQLQDKIEAVRVDLFQYIFERTQAVERLQAYNREREERNK